MNDDIADAVVRERAIENVLPYLTPLAAGLTFALIMGGGKWLWNKPNDWWKEQWDKVRTIRKDKD